MQFDSDNALAMSCSSAYQCFGSLSWRGDTRSRMLEECGQMHVNGLCEMEIALKNALLVVCKHLPNTYL